MIFGAVVPRYDVTFAEVLELAEKIRGFGYGSLWFTDHLQPSRARTVLETWTLMSALAPVVGGVRLGTTVLCYSYRHPSLLAKMAATLDQISGGRLELGVGLGSEPQAHEHRVLGIPYPMGRERYSWFREYVDVLRLLMSDGGEVRYAGQHYHLTGALSNTPPVQKPHPPIWIGARRRLMLRLVAEMGLGWNFYGESRDEFRDAVRSFEHFSQALGRDHRGVRKAVFTTILAYRCDGERAERMKYMPLAESYESALRKSFTLIYGTPDEIVEQVEMLRSMGVSLLILRDLDTNLSSLKLFAEDVMPSYSRAKT
ncbi:MAG: LLM class flavin-dependent oxidoreductase [Nitrososphaerota archaeon]